MGSPTLQPMISADFRHLLVFYLHPPCMSQVKRAESLNTSRAVGFFNKISFHTEEGGMHPCVSDAVLNGYFFHFLESYFNIWIKQDPDDDVSLLWLCNSLHSGFMHRCSTLFGSLVPLSSFEFKPWQQRWSSCQHCLNMSLHIGLSRREGHLSPERHNNLCQLIKLAYCWLRHWALKEHFVPVL